MTDESLASLRNRAPSPREAEDIPAEVQGGVSLPSLSDIPFAVLLVAGVLIVAVLSWFAAPYLVPAPAAAPAAAATTSDVAAPPSTTAAAPAPAPAPAPTSTPLNLVGPAAT